MVTLENIYDILEERKKDLNFRQRTDVVTELGESKFMSLVKDPSVQYDDIPDDILDFLENMFDVKGKKYDFIQIQKYEIGEYILPHKDAYPHFNLVCLSTSKLDGLTLEGVDGIFRFYPDEAGNKVYIPKYKWHWVNPVREKTRYTAVVGTNTNFTWTDQILAI
jgi:hypothetical protein